MNSKIFGIAAALVRSRRITLALVAAQFVYLGYKYLKEEKQKSLKNS